MQHSEAAIENLALSVEALLHPLIRPARREQARILGVKPEAVIPKSPRTSRFDLGQPSAIVDGEVFTDGKILFVVEVSSSNSNADYAWIITGGKAPQKRPHAENKDDVTLTVYYIGSDADHPVQQTFVSAVELAFRTSLSPHVFKSNRFQELKKEGRTSPSAAGSSEIDAARVLSSQHVRSLAVAIKSSGGLLVRDLAKQLPADARDQIDSIREAIASQGLVNTEIVIVCRKSQAQVARVPTREVLSLISEQGVKCACGRPILDESVEEALSITDLGRVLLDGSRWLTLLLVSELQDAGVEMDDILIEQQMGGDEVDCLAVISGELVFFELKDKDFSLGNAYSFGAKIGILRPDHAVIFSTSKVGGDARDHFERARLARGQSAAISMAPDDAQIYYVEGLSKLKMGVETLATAIYKRDATRVIQQVLRLAALHAEQLLLTVELAARPAQFSPGLSSEV